ncbi:acetate--CoA ligase family protein [Alcaligenaceae bacterium]|nr:acetate--CoA ligase family protein [Alcaligenaceae bacterium]
MTINSPHSIKELLHPRNVAIVGASGDISKWGGRLLSYMSKHPVEGRVFPINPKGEILMGVQSYPSLGDCPEPVDMAVLLVPGTRALASVKECAANGVKSVIAITSGFAETGPEGLAMEQQLVAEARKGGMRLIGPNCMGLLNTHHNLAATTAVTMAYVDKLPRGPIGMASQSGALMGAMLARGVDTGAGFSSMVSLGNQADVDQNDIFDYLIDDPKTEIIALYIEAVKGPARFVELLNRARQVGKPVLIVKSGRTAAGERAVMSHTASLAGAWASFEAICRAYGAYLFDNVFDLLAGAQLMARGQRMRKPGVAVFSGSGGGGALFVDSLDEIGLELPALSERTREGISEVLPPSHRELPIDFGVINHAAAPDPRFGDAIATTLGHVMEDEEVGAGIVFLTTQPNMDKVADSTVRVGEQCGKPLLFVHGASTVGDIARQFLRGKGYGYVESPNDAISVLSALWKRERPLASDNAPVSAFSIPADLGTGYLTEPDARRLLSAAGIPVTPWQSVSSIDYAIDVAATMDVPVVIKAVSPTLVHKSDVGAVKLNLDSDQAVRSACNDIAAALKKEGHELTGYLVTPMIRADAELIVGLQRDPEFGPMVMVGAGGVLVELMQDVQLCPAPLTREQAGAMLDRLRCKPLLDGWRGSKPVNREQLVDILVGIGQLAMQMPGLTELDINPLFIADGQLLAADARAVIADGELLAADDAAVVA